MHASHLLGRHCCYIGMLIIRFPFYLLFLAPPLSFFNVMFPPLIYLDYVTFCVLVFYSLCFLSPFIFFLPFQLCFVFLSSCMIHLGNWV
jgi:hypothetical protein